MTTATDTMTALGDGGDAIRVLSGDCTVIYDGDRRSEHRGHVTVLVKPDNTVLVHDADGYQPVAWLTRADAVSCSRGNRRSREGRRTRGDRTRDTSSDRARSARGDSQAISGDEPRRRTDDERPENDRRQRPTERASATDPEPGDAAATVTAPASTVAGEDSRSASIDRGAAFAVDAQDGDARLRVRAHVEDGYAAYPATQAGRPVGECPDCSGTLVRAGRSVTCIGCAMEHGLPDGATVRDERCACGRPRIRVERGAPLDVCLDRNCDPLLDAVRERFDRSWGCPRCGSDLRILRRGGLIAGCESYPDCEASYSIPAGTIVDECDCGLPVFETARSTRCLDGNCEERDGRS